MRSAEEADMVIGARRRSSRPQPMILGIRVLCAVVFGLLGTLGPQEVHNTVSER